MEELGKPTVVSEMSSGSEARGLSNRHAAEGGGLARSTGEAGQRPWREGAGQGSLPDGSNTAAPEADKAVYTKLGGLVERAQKEVKLTNVIQYLDEELLHLAFKSLRKQAAPGIDGQSYAEYAERLEENIQGLHGRLKSGRYRAPAVRRAYIAKATGGRRPLGISTVEDRMVQKAVAWLLSAVFEQDFLECSHGFRPRRSAHTALKRLREGILRGRMRYVVEVDIRSYFDTVNREWLRRFVRHRANDGGLIRLLGKWLKAGVLEDGMISHPSAGVPQGGPVSPVLANIYLHYVLDQWFEWRFKRSCRGAAELTRYADDFVAAFSYREDAERFRREVEERLKAFGLQVAPEKTAIRRFDGDLSGGGVSRDERPESFSFLGFSHYLTKTRRGKLNVGRKPSVKARERFLLAVRSWLRGHLHWRVWEQQERLRQMLEGFYQYFGLTLCVRTLNGIRWRVRKLWRAALLRRSQRAGRRCTWGQLANKRWFQLPAGRVTKASV